MLSLGRLQTRGLRSFHIVTKFQRCISCPPPPHFLGVALCASALLFGACERDEAQELSLETSAALPEESFVILEETPIHEIELPDQVDGMFMFASSEASSEAARKLNAANDSLATLLFEENGWSSIEEVFKAASLAWERQAPEAEVQALADQSPFVELDGEGEPIYVNAMMPYVDVLSPDGYVIIDGYVGYMAEDLTVWAPQERTSELKLAIASGTKDLAREGFIVPHDERFAVAQRESITQRLRCNTAANSDWGYEKYVNDRGDRWHRARWQLFNVTRCNGDFCDVEYILSCYSRSYKNRSSNVYRTTHFVTYDVTHERSDDTDSRRSSTYGSWIARRNERTHTWRIELHRIAAVRRSDAEPGNSLRTPPALRRMTDIVVPSTFTTHRGMGPGDNAFVACQ